MIELVTEKRVGDRRAPVVEKRDPLLTALIVSEIALMVGIAVCFGVVTLSVHQRVDALYERPQAISKAEFDNRMNRIEYDIVRLQRATRAQLMEQDYD